MDGFIRIVHKDASIAHQLWQIYFPQKLLVEFEKGSCRVIPHHRLNGEMKGFQKDHKRLAYTPEESLDFLLSAEPIPEHSPKVHRIIDNLYSQFSQLLMLYESR
jgi:hypothetical protein